MPGSPQHVTLVASAVTTVDLGQDYSVVEVLNVDGVAAVYFRFDATAPVVGATGTHVLPAAIGSVEVTPRTSGNTVVKLISAGTPQVSVRGVS